MSYTEPNCHCPPDSPKSGIPVLTAPQNGALVHAESSGELRRTMSAMSLDSDDDGEKPPRRTAPDGPGNEGLGLTQAARTLSEISMARRGAESVAPASAPAPWPPAAAPWVNPAEVVPAPPWAPETVAPASAPAPWPPATSPRYRPGEADSPGRLRARRERAATFDESDGRSMDVDACDACPYCHDTCADPDCPRCVVWRLRPRKMCRGLAVYCPCEVRRHASAESCWLVAGRDVFDVTAFLPRHPAGTKSIVRKAGGADCTEDLGFHSAKAQKLWHKHRIGRLEPCGADKGVEGGCLVS